MIVFNSWSSCLIHQQIRAEWVSAVRACTIPNYEIVKGLSIGTLVTDISLLLIMLAGLLRLRHRDRAFVHLEYVLWIQVGVLVGCDAVN